MGVTRFQRRYDWPITYLRYAILLVYPMKLLCVDRVFLVGIFENGPSSAIKKLVKVFSGVARRRFHCRIIHGNMHGWLGCLASSLELILIESTIPCLWRFFWSPFKLCAGQSDSGRSLCESTLRERIKMNVPSWARVSVWLIIMIGSGYLSVTNLRLRTSGITTFLGVVTGLLCISAVIRIGNIMGWWSFIYKAHS